MKYCTCKNPQLLKVNCRCGLPIREKQTIEQLEAERNKLLVSKENPDRLRIVQGKLDYFNFGIIK